MGQSEQFKVTPSGQRRFVDEQAGYENGFNSGARNFNGGYQPSNYSEERN
jgi:hypothetical protein